MPVDTAKRRPSEALIRQAQARVRVAANKREQRKQAARKRYLDLLDAADRDFADVVARERGRRVTWPALAEGASLSRQIVIALVNKYHGNGSA